MRLSYQIPLITGIILILTVLVNIVTFEVAFQALFPEYLENQEKESLSTNTQKLDALVQIGKLDEKDQKEYSAVISELSNVSTVLKNISENPELYVSSSGNIDKNIFTSNIAKSRNIVNILMNPGTFSRNTAEWNFILSLLTWISITNILWLLCVTLGYFFWTRRVFRPIDTVIHTLDNFLLKEERASIAYKRNDEFFPLVSAINNLSKSLAIQEKIRSDFLSDLSHEIRTPITAVKIYLEWIQDGIMKFDTKSLWLLSKELTRLISITEKIMEYEHLTGDSFDSVQVERFGYHKLLEEIRTEYTLPLKNNRQTIITDIVGDSMTRMDKWMCTQILHNIFSNFLKYAWEWTELICSYKKTTDMYILTFRDNGVWIPDSEIEFVREKFYRVDKWRTARDGSMGIWLSIIDRIARLHHGSFHIEKSSTTTGVCFEVRIAR